MTKQPSKKAPAKRTRGRPPGRTHDQQMQMRVSVEFLQTIDVWRSKQPNNPPRAEAIRRLVERATTELSVSLTERIDKHAESRGETRSEVMRRFVEAGLAAEAGQRKPRK
jgi:hypothetical protein